MDIMFGIRKVVRKDPVKDLIVGVPPALSGGIYLFGKPGCLSEDTKIFVLKNKKIIHTKGKLNL